MNFKHFIATISMVVCCLTANSQSLSFEEFHIQKGEEAIEVQDYGKALEHYEKLSKDNSNDSNYQYKTAWCYYKLKNYKKAIKIASKVLESNQRDVRLYRLLGNAFDLNGQYDQGIKILDVGIKIMPTSGELYFDKAVIEMERGNTIGALEIWEMGIKMAPYYADNYYWVAKLYADSNEKIWALMYAELFLNLERGTDRFAEISSLLTNTYLKLLREIPNVELGELYKDDEEMAAQLEFAYEWMVNKIKSGETLSLSNVPNNILNAKPRMVDKDMVIASNTMIQLQSGGAELQLNRTEKNKFYDAYLYTLTMLRENGILNLPVSGRLENGSYNLVKAVSFMRGNFVELYMQLFHQDMPIDLFVWQFGMQDRKLLEAYNHWLFSGGDPNYFIKWQAKHSDEYQIFLDALIAKPLKIDAENYFSRYDYY